MSIYIKNTLKTFAAAIATTVADISFGNILANSPLKTPIETLTSHMKFLTPPFHYANNKIHEFLQKIAPSTYFKSNNYIDDFNCRKVIGSSSFRCKLFSKPLLAGIPEEILYRGLMQQTILPWVASKLPSPVGGMLNAKITRIFLTSLLFAAAHLEDHTLQFGTGFIFGIAAEASQSLKVPILSHIIHSAFFLSLIANQ